MLLIINMILAQDNDYYNRAIKSFMNENFKEADYFFRKGLRENIAMSSTDFYYYGLTLYKLNKIEAAEKFLKDFISSNTNDTILIRNATILLKKLNPKNCKICNGSFYFTIDTICSKCDGKGTILSICKYCNGTKKIPCSQCMGVGFITYSDLFSKKKFKICETCFGNKIFLCDKCLLNSGETKICEICKGKGVISLRKSCKHE